MPESNLKITFIGHATSLIQLGERSFLTDPNFSNKIKMRWTRQQPPGIPAYQLPPLDALLVSNANYDHLDIFSYKFFKGTVPIVVPKGLGKLLQKFLPNPVTEIKKGGSHRYFETSIHSVAVNKRGYRWLPLRFGASAAFVLEAPAGTVYFAGDTGYGDVFKKVRQQYSIDVAILPIQAHPSHKTGPKSSLGPVQALQAFEELGAKTLIPTRWDAFKFGKQGPEELIREFRDLAAKAGLLERVRILKPGEAYSGSL